jgi:ABC-type amino acid transport/signal transduction systems, periplasmic component/domain
MKNWKKFALSTAITLLGVSVLVACGNSSEKEDSSKKTTIVLATDADTKPFTYSDDGKITGYDIEVARAVFKKLPQYDLKIEVTDFSAVMTGLDTGKYHIGANDIGYNDERAEKYYFSYPISESTYAVATRDGDKVSKLADLAGKKTELVPGTNYTQILENWNKKNPQEKVIINYADQVPLPTRLGNIESKKSDFLLYDSISLNTVIKEQGLDLQVNPIDLQSDDKHSGDEYFVFTKDEEGKKLQKEVDKALHDLEKDGSLKKLSEEFFKGDYVPASEDFK